MDNFLNPDHPDANAQPGDKREALGKVWTFGANQFSKYWVSGPKDGRVACSKDYPHVSNNPYLGDGLACATFEKAAERSCRGAKREYEKALDIVRRYEGEADEEVYLRDLDGSGSMHVCVKGDTGSVRYVRG